MSEKKIDVDRIAALARLRLDDAEKTRLASDLEKILEYIDQLNRLDTADVEPTSHVLPIHNVFREDTPGKKHVDGLIDQAPGRDKGHYEVPQII
ncbi:MAG: Asp-tRNA(Asn)/Glu-tRNA(Gln) amidotransferase subunit GatC [Nitrospinales bacterium]